MTKSVTLRTTLILVGALACALGGAKATQAKAVPLSTQPARADAALRVKAYGGLTRRGFRMYRHFRAQGEGVVTLRLTVRLKARVALKRTLTRVSPSWDNVELWTTKPIRTSFPAGLYSYCVVAVDSGGRHAKSCDSLRVL